MNVTNCRQKLVMLTNIQLSLESKHQTTAKDMDDNPAIRDSHDSRDLSIAVFVGFPPTGLQILARNTPVIPITAAEDINIPCINISLLSMSNPSSNPDIILIKKPRMMIPMMIKMIIPMMVRIVEPGGHATFLLNFAHKCQILFARCLMSFIR